MKVNFLNWRPDQDEYQLDGLTKAENVVHDTEGYKPVYLKSAGAFSTGIDAAESVLSVVARQGIWPTTAFTAYIEDNDQTTPTLRFGYFYNTGQAMYEATWGTTGYPSAHAFATSGASGWAVVAFDVAYLGEKSLHVAVAEQILSTGSTQTVSALGVSTDLTGE